ncbi:FIST signal transduction protein [Thiohalorhabdus sp. Cl-TMA]|uniref:FIST C-terminal domain-containing protein n=1 Tax=Thiohalorhabdus methylotrophus TaxID=3242694 RepID=A0ABV4TRR8_9GAMM
MERFRAGHAGGPLWRDAADSCLEQVGTLPAGANLGFVYVTDEWSDEFSAVVDYLKAHTGIERWVGTVGAGVCGPGKEYHMTPAMSLLVGAFPGDGIRLLPTLEADLDDLRAELAPWYRGYGAVQAVVHGDPRNEEVPELIGRLADELPDGFLVGGVTATRGRAYPQVAGSVTQGGLSGVLLSEETPLVTGLTQGCTPIGPHREVTACDGNALIELDGRPALDVFYEDIGELLARDLNKVAGYIFAGFPQGGADSGDYLVRNLVGVNEEKKVVGIGEEVTEGQKVMFCRRDGNTAREDLVRMVREVRDRAGGSARGALYFSCVGRGASLFGESSNELRLVQQELGDVPLAGFFCNGEIYDSRLYGYTGVLALFP